jgi:flagellar hook-length control protein FliK
MLLENALTGALAGAWAGVPAPTSATASAAPSGGTSPQDSRVTVSNGAASALETVLGQGLATDPKAPAATLNPRTSAPPVTATATPTAAAAALTAAQLAPAVPAGSPHAKPDPATMAVSAPVGSSGWTDELGAKVTWMAHQGIESASLQLSPEHLGPLQVTISVHDGQASVWFGAAQPDTRTALQQSLPQLRQLFASQGLHLADAGVSRESPRGQDRQRAARTVASVAGVTAVSPDTSSEHSITVRLGLVDTYV